MDLLRLKIKKGEAALLDINPDINLLPTNIKQAVLDYRDTINMSKDTLRIA